jgi:hypothetical protein
VLGHNKNDYWPLSVILTAREGSMISLLVEDLLYFLWVTRKPPKHRMPPCSQNDFRGQMITVFRNEVHFFRFSQKWWWDRCEMSTCRCVWSSLLTSVKDSQVVDKRFTEYLFLSISTSNWIVAHARLKSAKNPVKSGIIRLGTRYTYVLAYGRTCVHAWATHMFSCVVD